MKKPGENVDEKILTLLRARPGRYLSGEDISEQLGVSRAALWKHIDALRRHGYKITAIQNRGYCFVSAPERLTGIEIAWGLRTRTIGKKIVAFKRTDSTNTVAEQLARDGASAGTIVVAESQERGRGRFQRRWESPEGGIYLSIITRPELEPRLAAGITLAAAIAVAVAIRRVTGLNPRIKWPNDILIDGRKICGILTEMRAQQDKIDYCITGIGVNVNCVSRDLPACATSVLIERNAPVSRAEITRAILEAFESEYEVLMRDFQQTVKKWKTLSDTLGRHIRVLVQHEHISGTAIDIDEHGALILELADGSRRQIYSGDVELV